MEGQAGSHFRAKKDSFLRRYSPVFLALIVGCALSVVLFFILEDTDNERLQTEFNRRAGRRAIMIQNIVEAEVEVLYRIRDLYTSSQSVERKEFRAFVRTVLLENPQIFSLQWVPRVSDSERAAFEEAAEKEGWTGFQIIEKDDNDRLAKAQNRKEHFPIYYVESLSKDEPFLGYDLASDLSNHRAMRKASESGNAATASWIGSIAAAWMGKMEETEGQSYCRVFVPVYREGMTGHTPEERRDNLQGFIVGIFCVEEMVEKPLEEMGAGGLDVYLYDRATTGDLRLLHFHPSEHGKTQPLDESDIRSGLHREAGVNVAGREWTLFFSPASDMIAAEETYYSYGVLAVGLVFTGLIVAFLQGSMRRSVKVQRLATNLSKSNEKLEEEINQRARAQEELAASRAELERIFQSAGSAIRFLNMDFTVRKTNDVMTELVGIPREQMEGKKCHETLPCELCHTESCPLTMIGEGKDFAEMEVVNRRSDGSAVPCLITAAPFMSAAGEIAGVIEVIIDITDRKKAEEQIKKSNADLKQVNEALGRRNRELDEFSYVASHDLQEPLRKVIAFSGMLRNDLGENLPESAAKDIDFVTDAAGRMQKLVQDLLALSRVGRVEMALGQVSLQECADEAIRALAVRVEEMEAEITRDELPDVWGDKTMLTQLYQNLIGNALKFAGDARPKIHLAAEKSDDGWMFGVRDNGIGIKPEYADQIFAPFKRLHGRGEYEGSGIGLAICRKTVERHGGDIWVESEPGLGAHFKFTIVDRMEEKLWTISPQESQPHCLRRETCMTQLTEGPQSSCSPRMTPATRS